MTSSEPPELRALPVAARVVALLLQMVAVANVVYLAAHLVEDLTTGSQTAPLFAVAMGLLLFSGVPWFAVKLGQRWLGFVAEPARAFGENGVAYIDAKARPGWRPRLLAILKWGILPLAMAVIFFRLDQYIVYGGPWGLYRAQGLGAYLTAFATYWLGAASYMVLYASVVRIAVEPLALAATLLIARRARLVRAIAEGVCQFAYFVLLPAYVAVRLLI